MAKPRDLSGVFEALKPIYSVHAPTCVVLFDEPGKYYLGTHEVRVRDGYRTWFGGVEIKKNYVSAHLMPVYAHPEMLDDLSPILRKRMQGKSCFNFARPDPELFKELALLTKAGYDFYRKEGYL